MTDLGGMTFKVGRGCTKCNYLGYRGRIAIHELLVLNDHVKDAVIAQKSSFEIRRTSLEPTGMVSLLEDAIYKSLQGKTTFEEIIRQIPRLGKPRPVNEIRRAPGRNPMNQDNSLLDKIEELIESGNLEMPVFNESAAKLQTLNADGDIGTSEVEELILGDQVLVAEVLRAANSPFFGGLSKISTVRNALVRLGLKQVSRLAIAASHRSQYNAKNPELHQMIRDLWQHASATAIAGAWIARKLKLWSTTGRRSLSWRSAP